MNIYGNFTAALEIPEIFVNKEPQLYAVQKLRKMFAQIFTEKTLGSSINIYGFATTYNDASTHDGSGNRPKTSVLHATISLLHFQNCFDSFERMSQVQQPVAASF